MERVDHRSLKVWKLARKLVVELYRWSATLPVEERYGLVRQMRRAVISIPSNLSEGAARGSSAEFRRFALIARGSLAELQTQLTLTEDLGFSNRQDHLHLRIENLLRALSGLVRHLESLGNPASP